jgi:hypothetical protein
MKTFKTLSLGLMHYVLMFVIENRAPYSVGGKIEPLSNLMPVGIGVDCSGFIQWLVYQASGAKTLMPEGSEGQRSWCNALGFQRVSYAQALNDKTAACYLCFAWKFKPGDRHVWLVRMGKSWESWSGYGPGVRPAKTLWHRLNCRACYKISN